MSDTSMTKEILTAVKYFNLRFNDIEKITINAMKSSFIHHNERLGYIYRVIKPGFQKVREELSSQKRKPGKNEEETFSEL
jgi:adenosine deaminase